MNRWLWKTVSISILFLALVFAGLLPKGTDGPYKGGYYRVIKVSDGDTVSIMINGSAEKLRLIGIDAPEMGQRPWGEKSKRRLERIISSTNRNVSVEYDIDKRDGYGRLLAYLWTENREMVNLKMLKDGYALMLTVPPNVRHVEKFRKAQKEAYEKRLGIWGNKGLKEKPVSYRERHRLPGKKF